MTKNGIYGYLLGQDFNDIADQVVERIDAFIQSRSWICSQVWPVNQRRIAFDGEPKWELGFNIDLPDPWQELPGWFSDIEALIDFSMQLRREFAHDVVIGISDNHTGCAEDVIEIGSEYPDVEYLRRFIGIALPP